MPESGTIFASAGENIKLWDASTLQVVKQYNHHKGNVKDVCWSSDNSIICSTSSVGDKVSVCDWKHVDKPKVVCECALGESQTCVKLSPSGKKIYSAGVAGDVNVWDRESGKLRKAYKDTHKNPITCIALNDTETYIASGSNKGSVVIRNLNSDVTMQPQMSSKGHAVRSMVFSPWKHSLLGMALDDGSVTLWDSLQQTTYHNFIEVHKAPAMSFSFSHFNDLIFASVGLDKHLVVYDVKRHKVINKTVVDQPLTSVTFVHDGVSLFAGSSLGKIYQFDLRSLSHAVKDVAAHTTSVQKLVCENIIKVKKSKSRKTQNGQDSRLIGEETPLVRKAVNTDKRHGRGDFEPKIMETPATQKQQINGAPSNGYPLDSKTPAPAPKYVNSTPSVAGRFNYHNVDDLGGLISPVRDDVFGNMSVMSQEGQHLSNLTGNVLSSSRDTVGSYCDDLLSPVAASSKIGVKQRTPVAVGVQSNTRTSPHPLRISNNLPQEPAPGKKDPKMPVIKNKLAPDVPVARQPLQKPPVDVDPIVPSSSSSITLSVPKVAQQRRTPSDANSASRVPSDVTQTELSSVGDQSSVSTAVAGGNSGDVTAFQYQAEYLRHTVKELVDEMGDELRSQTNEMMTVMVKLFLQQEDTIRTLIQEQRCGINEQLLQEVERLKEENERLRRTF